jgi:hypothetical protein
MRAFNVVHFVHEVHVVFHDPASPPVLAYI